MNTTFKKPRPTKIIFFVCFAIAALAAISGIVMLLWNWLMPLIFKLPSITFLQAFGLFILFKILFGSYKFGKPNRKPPFANAQFREKFMNMSQEEKQCFKEQWQERFNH